MNIETIQVTFRHPTDSYEFVVIFDEDIRLRDIYSHLVDNGFLVVGRLHCYAAFHKGIELDNNKAISENRVENNDIVQIVSYTRGAG